MNPYWFILYEGECDYGKIGDKLMINPNEIAYIAKA